MRAASPFDTELSRLSIKLSINEFRQNPSNTCQTLEAASGFEPEYGALQWGVRWVTARQSGTKMRKMPVILGNLIRRLTPSFWRIRQN
jgi:hypothetical protein